MTGRDPRPASGGELAVQAAVLRDRGLRQADIAAELGISQPRVSRLLSGRSGHEARGVAHTAHNPVAHTAHTPDVEHMRQELSEARRTIGALRAELPAPGAGPVTASCENCARLEADYEALEAERDELARRLDAWEGPS